jgi:hypothetical protein
MLNVNKIKDLMNRSGKSREFFYQELGISQAKFYIRMRIGNHLALCTSCQQKSQRTG